MPRTTLLEYKRYRDLKASLAVMAASLLAYGLYHPETGHFGGTPLGYVLGCTGLGMVLFLLWYGIHIRRLPASRERRQARDLSSVGGRQQAKRQDSRALSRQMALQRASTRQGWLSAHVYYGLALVLVVTLHTGFHFGWNVHTAAYGLLLGVVLSGLYGVYAYIRFPRMMTENLGGETLDSLLHKISRLHEQCVGISNQLPAEFGEISRRAARETKIGGNLIRQLNPDKATCPTNEAVIRLHALGNTLDSRHAALHRELYAAMLKAQSLVARARLDIQLRAGRDLWRFFHIPLAIALMVALLAHLLAIVIYW